LDVDIERYEIFTDSNKADIFIKINEGFLTLISDVKIYGNKVLDENEILSILDLKKILLLISPKSIKNRLT